jgi:hypothetical protein
VREAMDTMDRGGDSSLTKQVKIGQGSSLGIDSPSPSFECKSSSHNNSVRRSNLGAPECSGNEPLLAWGRLRLLAFSHARYDAVCRVGTGFELSYDPAR